MSDFRLDMSKMAIVSFTSRKMHFQLEQCLSNIFGNAEGQILPAISLKDTLEHTLVLKYESALLISSR